jgi:hypothetical protein
VAKTVTLLSLRTQIRQRADMENAGLVADAELTQYINNSIGEFDDLLLAADAATRRKTTTISVVANQDTYALPSDFRDLKGVEYLLSGTSYLDVRALPFEQRNRFALSPAPQLPGVVPFRYFLNSDGSSWSLVFKPIPSAGATVRAWYTPAFTSLAADGDTLDGVNGLEEFVVVDCAIKCLQKEESDVSALFAQKSALVARIEATAKARDQSEPQKVGEAGLVTGWDGSGWED